METAHRPPSRQPQLGVQVQQRGPIANHFLAQPQRQGALVAIAALAVEDDADFRGVWSAGKSERLPTRLAGAVDQLACLGGDGAASVPKSRGSLRLDHGLDVGAGAIQAGSIAKQVGKDSVRHWSITGCWKISDARSVARLLLSKNGPSRLRLHC